MTAEEFVARYVEAASKVRGQLSYRGATADEIDDVMQTAALKAWARREQLRDAGKFRAWLTTIAVMVWLGEKRVSREMVEVTEGLRDPAIGPEDLAIRRNLREKALGSINETQRGAVVGMYVYGKSEAELSRMLHVPRTTVKARLHYWRLTVRKRLA